MERRGGRTSSYTLSRKHQFTDLRFFSLWHYSPYLSLVLLCIEVSYSHPIIRTTGLLWSSDQPFAEASTYTGQHNTYIQETKFHTRSRIRTHVPSKEATSDLRLRLHDHQDRLTCTLCKINQTWMTSLSLFQLSLSFTSYMQKHAARGWFEMGLGWKQE
jgi:hypothetical protein